MLCHSFMVHLHNHMLVHSLEHPIFTSLTHSVTIPFTHSIILSVTHSVTFPFTHLHTHACLLSQSPQALLISPLTVMCQVLETQLILIICRLHICQFIYLLKFACNPKIISHATFVVTCKHAEKQEMSRFVITWLVPSQLRSIKATSAFLFQFSL